MKTRQKSHTQVTQRGGALKNYQDTIVGTRSFGKLIYFEVALFFAALPGALGLLMRKILWPKLFKRCGTGTVFGANVVLRHPHRISLGERCVISDGCILDARSEDMEAISIGSDCILSNYVMISCKNGTVDIGERAGIGAQTWIMPASV